MWRSADCGALAVNFSPLVALAAVFPALITTSTLSEGVPTTLSVKAVDITDVYLAPSKLSRTSTKFVYRASLKPGSTWYRYSWPLVSIERFTAVAGNDNDNTIGVGKGAGSRDEFHGGGAGRRQWGSSGGRASVVKIAFRHSSICNAKILEPDRALRQISNWENSKSEIMRRKEGRKYTWHVTWDILGIFGESQPWGCWFKIEVEWSLCLHFRLG
ncbi:hypothetical protein R3P38DRAFT_2781424 [Favolaschia claudopus]|uniref:Uncharacterized protein n=1 Tax=Favolaschia claudopus TaxID=2862362 RepID=A0AAW0B3Y6_9AGAR